MPTRTLVWRNPSFPVFAAITTNHLNLVLEKPAVTTQALHTIKEVGRCGGLVGDVTTHDLRRGGAKDMKSLAKINAGPGPEIAQALGHSAQAYDKGVTARYAEKESMFILNSKEEQLKEDPFGPRLVPVPRKKIDNAERRISNLNDFPELDILDQSYVQKKRRVQMKETEEWENTLQIDAVKAPHPKRAKRGAVAAEREVIQERTKSQMNVIAATVLAKRGSKESLTFRNTSNTDLGSIEIDAVKTPVPKRIKRGLSTSTSKQLPSLPTVVEEDTSNIDPILLELSQDIPLMSDQEANAMLNRICGMTSSSDTPPDTNTVAGVGEDALTGEEEDLVLETLDSRCLIPILEAPVIDFINCFSSINICRRHSNDIRKFDVVDFIKAGYATGNSRDPPTRFSKKCSHSDQGCKFEHYSARELSSHEFRDCLWRPDATAREIKKRTRPPVDKNKFKCSQCDKTFGSETARRNHLKQYHSAEAMAYIPKSCDQGCASSHIFKALPDWKDHCKRQHPVEGNSFQTKLCDLQSSCHRKKPFDSVKTYRRHLRKSHRNLTTEEIFKLAPELKYGERGGEIRAQWKAQECPIGGTDCPLKRPIKERKHMVRHLTGQVHRCTLRAANKLCGIEVAGQDVDENEKRADIVCPLGHCSKEGQVFAKLQQLKTHLAGSEHDSPRSQIDGLIAEIERDPSASIDDVEKYPCPIGNCDFAIKGFPQLLPLMSHLRGSQHSCSPERVTELVQQVSATCDMSLPIKEANDNEHEDGDGDDDDNDEDEDEDEDDDDEDDTNEGECDLVEDEN